MSKVNSEIIRVQDQLLIKLFIYLGKEHAEWNYIEFRKDDLTLDILSTTEGAIRKKRVILLKQKPYLEICLNYISDSFDCVIAYLDGDNLLKHETTLIEPEQIKSITKAKDETDFLATSNNSFAERLQELYERLTSRRSLWHLKLELDKNIKVTVLRSGKASVNVAFGRSSYEPVSGDFIFSLDPEIKNFIIPTELVWRNYHEYEGKAHLAVFELVQADFHRIPNMFYKSPISNSVALSHFPKVITTNSVQFSSPLGLSLPQEHWKCDYGLPTWRGNE
jgi:hypothetical protein